MDTKAKLGVFIDYEVIDILAETFCSGKIPKLPGELFREYVDRVYPASSLEARDSFIKQHKR